MHEVHQTSCFYAVSRIKKTIKLCKIIMGLTINKKSHVTIVFHHMEWPVAHIQAFFSLSDIWSLTYVDTWQSQITDEVFKIYFKYLPLPVVGM